MGTENKDMSFYPRYSPAHAGNVALVPNAITGHDSPQYHVEFITVYYFNLTDEAPPFLCNLVKKSQKKVTDERYNTV